jgi:hypothetical protein
MLNPAHERFKDVQIVSRERITLDKRLYVAQQKPRR